MAGEIIEKPRTATDLINNLKIYIDDKNFDKGERKTFLRDYRRLADNQRDAAKNAANSLIGQYTDPVKLAYINATITTLSSEKADNRKASRDLLVEEIQYQISLISTADKQTVDNSNNQKVKGAEAASSLDVNSAKHLVALINELKTHMNIAGADVYGFAPVEHFGLYSRAQFGSIVEHMVALMPEHTDIMNAELGILKEQANAAKKPFEDKANELKNLIGEEEKKVGTEAEIKELQDQLKEVTAKISLIDNDLHALKELNRWLKNDKLVHNLKYEISKNRFDIKFNLHASYLLSLVDNFIKGEFKPVGRSNGLFGINKDEDGKLSLGQAPSVHLNTANGTQQTTLIPPDWLLELPVYFKFGSSFRVDDQGKTVDTAELMIKPAAWKCQNDKKIGFQVSDWTVKIDVLGWMLQAGSWNNFRDPFYRYDWGDDFLMNQMWENEQFGGKVTTPSVSLPISNEYIDKLTAVKDKANKSFNTSLSDAIKAGATPEQLINAGLTVKQLKDNGFTINQLLSAGVTKKQLMNAGFDVKQIKQVIANGVTPEPPLQLTGDAATQLKYLLIAVKDDNKTAVDAEHKLARMSWLKGFTAKISVDIGNRGPTDQPFIKIEKPFGALQLFISHGKNMFTLMGYYQKGAKDLESLKAESWENPIMNQPLVGGVLALEHGPKWDNRYAYIQLEHNRSAQPHEGYAYDYRNYAASAGLSFKGLDFLNPILRTTDKDGKNHYSLDFSGKNSLVSYARFEHINYNLPGTHKPGYLAKQTTVSGKLAYDMPLNEQIHLTPMFGAQVLTDSFAKANLDSKNIWEWVCGGALMASFYGAFENSLQVQAAIGWNAYDINTKTSHLATYQNQSHLTWSPIYNTLFEYGGPFIAINMRVYFEGLFSLLKQPWDRQPRK
ncbi:MAG: hypothetical protein JW841_15035 [Deltaproteobacteria bacterium]|nr:hypothetical protein [Deltaproteobacteria bacterium]